MLLKIKNNFKEFLLIVSLYGLALYLTSNFLYFSKFRKNKKSHWIFYKINIFFIIEIFN